MGTGGLGTAAPAAAAASNGHTNGGGKENGGTSTSGAAPQHQQQHTKPLNAAFSTWPTTVFEVRTWEASPCAHAAAGVE
jgi:hypothetical protein